MHNYQVAMVIGNSDEREPEVMTTVEATDHRDAMRAYFANSLHPRVVTQRQIHATMVGDNGTNQDSNHGLHYTIDGVEYVVTDMDIVTTNRPAKLTETKLGNMMIGQNITVPTIAWGTWTGELRSIRFPEGQYAPEGDVFFTIRHETGTEEEVRTNLNYSGYINKDITIKTDEDVAKALGTTVDDQRPEDTNGRMTPLEKMIRSSTYGLTDEQVAEAMVGTGEAFDVNSIHPSELLNDGEMIVTDVKVPDYADIMRLENMVWNATALRTDYQEYAKEFHRLATEFTEDVLILCLEQYNSGRKW